MSTRKNEPTGPVKLRLDAETRLEAGSAPPTSGWSVGVTALGSLHQLASTPDKAIDALKLLHELQVHQVELDLQHEQMAATQRELADDLARYQGLYEHAPVGFLDLGPQREILESNIAGAGLLATSQGELRGCNLDAFLAPASRPVLVHLLEGLRPSGPSEACEVHVNAGKGSRKLQILASVAPGGRSFLIVLLDLGDRS